jgi:hypothetical protein
MAVAASLLSSGSVLYAFFFIVVSFVSTANVKRAYSLAEC